MAIRLTVAPLTMLALALGLGVASTLPAQVAPSPPPEASSPQDVVTKDTLRQWLREGVPDEELLMRIREAVCVRIPLQPKEELISLHELGLSRAVFIEVQKRIAAQKLYDRLPSSSVYLATLANSSGSGWLMPQVVAFNEKETRRLSSTIGALDSVALTGLLFCNLPNLSSRACLSPRSLSFLVWTPNDPLGRYLLVRLKKDVPENLRSLKIGDLGALKARESLRPDPDWRIPFVLVREAEGRWRLIPTQELPPGEYAIFNAEHFMELFDFTVKP